MDVNHIYSSLRELIKQKNPLSGSQTDKRVVYTGLTVLSIFVLVIFYNVFIGDAGKYQKQLSVLEKDIKKVRLLADEYHRSKQRLDELSGAIKKENESLISVVEKIFIDNGIKRKNFSIKDSKLDETYSYELSGEATVQVDINEVPFRRVIDVLYSIQSRDSFLKVSNLRVKTKFNNSSMVDASFKLSTFEIVQDT